MIEKTNFVKPKFIEDRLFILAIFFRITSDMVYRLYLSKMYAYQGFINDFTVDRYVESWLIFVCLYFFMNFKNKNDIRLSYLVNVLLYYLSITPFTTLVAYGVGSDLFVICNSIYWTILIFGIRFINRLPYISYKKVVIPNYMVEDRAVFSFSIIAALVIVYISARYTGFRFGIGISSVYSLRSEVRTYGIPIVINYMFCWTRTLISIFYAYSLYQRKWIQAIIFVVLQILAFNIDGMKSTLFMIPLVSAVILFVAKEKMDIVLGISIASIVIFVCALMEPNIFGTYITCIYIVYRTFFLPTHIGSSFFDYFTSHEPDYFRSSFLRRLGIGSPYSPPGIDFIISGTYYGSENSAANNGLISDAIANLGIMGVVIMPLVVCMVLRYLDRCTARLNMEIILVVAFSVSLILMNAFISVALVTNGILVLGVVLIYMKRGR
nr:hypothetical protein [uncultured Butyrivibrio sp.]